MGRTLTTGAVERFEAVQGAYPTGVCLVSATDGDGKHHGLIVGSFVSISIDPPLVGFCPAKSSTTWPLIREIGAFCVNVLAADHLDVCDVVRSKAPDGLDKLMCDKETRDHPVIAGAQAWFKCTLDQALELGDHYMVIGKVEEAGGKEGGEALVYHRRKYCTTEYKLGR